MASLKEHVPLRTAVVVAVLVLVASIVSGRERADSTAAAPDTRAAPEANVQHMDLAGLKLARGLDAATDQPALPGVDRPALPGVRAAAVLGRDGDIAVPEPREPAPVRPVAARREAPPLPFTYLGQMIDQGKTTVFVTRGEDHYGLQPGLVIDDAYQVERITDSQVTFVYVPLGIRQVLPVPSLKAE